MSTITTPATDLKAKKIAFYADPNTKPSVAPPDFDAIPEELRREHGWALWQLVQRGGKWTKRPCQANGRGAKANDPSTWASFESVRRAYRRGGFDGIGIMLGGGLAGVDLDGVRDPDTGKFVRPANALGRRFATYAEVSPSGDRRQADRPRGVAGRAAPQAVPRRRDRGVRRQPVLRDHRGPDRRRRRG